jgi:hypothetical protein
MGREPTSGASASDSSSSRVACKFQERCLEVYLRGVGFVPETLRTPMGVMAVVQQI